MFKKGCIPWTTGQRNGIDKKCLICGKTFYAYPYINKTRKYCSKKCSYLSPERSKKLRLANLGKKGHPSWNKGKKGVMPIPWNKGKKLPQITGKKHWNWQSGKTTLNKQIRVLYEYKNWQNQILKRDNYTCQDCKKRRIYLIPHHKKAFALILQEFLNQYSQFSLMEDRETILRLAINYKPFWDLNNGKSLCKDCHKKTDNYKGKTTLRPKRTKQEQSIIHNNLTIETKINKQAAQLEFAV